MKAYRLLCAAALVGSGILGGCSTQSAFTYPMEPIRVVNSNPPDVRIAVLPANDLRPTKNNWWTVAWANVPLVPWGWITYERPEAGGRLSTIREYDASMAEDISKAVAQHLQQAGYAKFVFFDYGGNVDRADYVIDIDLESTRFHARRFTYGISILANYLWLIGIPIGDSEVSIALNVTMRDKDSNMVWQRSLTSTEKITQGMYYNWGADMEPLATGLQSALDELVNTVEKPSI